MIIKYNKFKKLNYLIIEIFLKIANWQSSLVFLVFHCVFKLLIMQNINLLMLKF